MKEAEPGQYSAPKVKCPKCDFPNPADQPACSRCHTPLPRVKMQADSPAPQGQDDEITFRRGQIVANRYTIVDMIGRGGMGCIYRVRDNTLNEDVALKTLLPQFVRDKVVVERFYNEARIARQLSHVNIVRVHDIGFAGSILYISMEFLRGKSLRSMLDELPTGTRLPLRLTLAIMDQLCNALEYAHRYTVHRDIKPENVMMSQDGTIKLMDFGISKLVTHTQLTAASMVMGTPYYMSPEQLKDSSAVDARADIYSVGVLLYEMLTGNLPTGIIKPASQILREVPPSLDPIVARCVEPDPRNRFASAAELREALRPIRDLIESGTNVHAPAAPPRAQSGSGWILKAVGVLLILAILGISTLGIAGLELRRRAALAAASGTKPAPAGDPSVPGNGSSELEDLLALLPTAAERAQEAAGNDAALVPVLDLAVKHAQAAEKARRQNPDAALDEAWHALQCYLGVFDRPAGMVFVPPGDVKVPLEPDRNTLAFSASLDGFFIDAAETTNGEYASFVREAEWREPAYNDLAGNPLYSANAQPDRPVTMVTLYDAQAYAAWKGKKLPTEAQWVLATYGWDGKPRPYPWDPPPVKEDAEEEPEDPDARNAEEEPPKVRIANTADPADDTPGLATPGQMPFDRTPTGCLDMAGNVTEWTRTFHSVLPETSGTEVAVAAGEVPPFGKWAVTRGGNFAAPPAPLTARYPVLYQARFPNLGFRCVTEIPRNLALLKKRV